jgi:hypothetical protein
MPSVRKFPGPGPDPLNAFATPRKATTKNTLANPLCHNPLCQWLFAGILGFFDGVSRFSHKRYDGNNCNKGETEHLQIPIYYFFPLSFIGPYRNSRNPDKGQTGLAVCGYLP